VVLVWKKVLSCGFKDFAYSQAALALALTMMLSLAGCETNLIPVQMNLGFPAPLVTAALICAFCLVDSEVTLPLKLLSVLI
jgi:hypothetical protein